MKSTNPAMQMVGWYVDCTWTPAPGTYTAKTVRLRFKAHATNSAYVLAQAQAQTQDMDVLNPVTLGTPTVDPDQSWVGDQ